METILQENVKEQWIRDMQIYAIATNRQQTVPDIKDSFKTVARRIITDMFIDKHLKFNGNRIKSAGPVGSTMEKYHPHGDCIHGSTLLYSLSGEFISIENIYNLGIKYLDILAVDPNTNKITPAKAHSFRIGQYTKKEYHIVLSNGAEVICTSNHPFLTGKGEWIKAENLVPFTRLYTKPLRLNDRPLIDNQLIQNMVYEKYYGILPNGYDKHHKDFNFYNNIPENIIGLSHQEHELIHGKSDSALLGLAKGRESLKGKYKEKNAQKNSILCQQYNKDQGLRRFKHAINILKERNLDITIENYELLRTNKEIYNLPYIDKLLLKYNINSFEDLININLPSLGELYTQNKIIELVDWEYKNDNVPSANMMYRFNIYNILNIMLDIGIPLTPENYFNCRQESTRDIDYDILKGIIALYSVEYPYIVNIYTIDVDNEPMYDFTVDGYENMMIPIYNNTGTGLENMLGCYSPMICIHNSSIYDVICKMAAWWDCKIPLIDGHGNFGNMQGDRAAAMRYTEVKLSEFCCEAVIGDLAKSKDIVDWVPNFDESGMEPEFLPVKVPLLLINGTFGIGLGMRSEISRHNITEVIQAAIDVLKNPDAEVVLIPDQCMPCDIIDTNWKRISNTGFGTYRCRGRIDIETNSKGNPQLIIKSIPDTVTLFLSKGGTDKGVIADINDFIKKGKLPQIIDMKDDSKGNDLRYIIELRKGSNPNFVKEYLYKHTLLQKTFRVNFEVLDGIEPLRCSYKSYIEYFINFQIDLKYRTYYSLLQNAKTKWREKQLYVMVMESGEIRNIQDKIHQMKNVSTEAKNEFMEYLIKKFNVTDIEAQFIMNMDQMRTAIGYLDIYKKEIADYQILIDEYLNKITNEDIIKAEIIEELEYFKKKYGRPRICRIIKDKEDIPAGEFLIVITENNYIKKINVGDNINSFKGDAPKFVLKIDNRENLLLFNKAGKVFKLPISKVDMCDKNSQGFDLRIMIKNYTSDTTTIMNEASVIKLASKRTKQFLVVLTSQGWIKKMDLDDFINVPPSGILYTKLNENDFVKDITIVPNSVDIVVYSDKKALRFTMEDVNHYKRSSYGVISMNTKEPIDGLSVITKDSTYIVVISESGKINKFDATGLACKKRNQAGSAVIKLGKTDKIHTIYGVNDSNILKIITKTGPIEVNVSDIPIGSSISGGTKYASNILKVSVI